MRWLSHAPRPRPADSDRAALTDILREADLAVANLETSVGTGGTPENKQYTYQAPPSAIDALRAGGFDVITMANNHGRDFGPDGLAESLAVK